ncbi:MAG TPA: FixH family protein [Ktedonobacteraceae bacterium]|nr:FixH family protein [Ktedonobacteraceae bacterium]
MRAIFWYLLAFACVGVLLFASTVHLSLPAVLQVRVAQTLSTARGFETSIVLQLSDTQGTPIDRAQITPEAYMTNMHMSAEHMQVFKRGAGHYNILIPLSMAGPWAIHIAASADGFDTQQQNLFLEVT